MKPLVAGCIGLLLSIAALCAWPQVPAPRAEVDTLPTRVPVLGDLRGKRCDEAGAELRRLHFALKACPYGTRTGRYPADTINWQSLPAGTPASRLGELRVALEPPVPVAELPDLRGKTCDQARAELHKLGLALAECRPGSARVRTPPRTINAQSHAPGTPVSRVDALRVTYEPGTDAGSSEPPLPDRQPPPPRSGANTAAAIAAAAALAAVIAEAAKAQQKLPDLRGMTCEQAASALRQLRIALAECLPGKAGSRYPAATINAQSPAPGTPLARVDRVRVRVEPEAVAQPPMRPLRQLPDVRGMTCAEATELLAKIDVAPTSCSVAAEIEGARPGRINAQSPAAGTTLPLATPLVLRVQPEAKVIVPALVGLDEAKALAALRDRSLQARTSGPDAARGRRVLTQSPAAGTPVAPGSVVDAGLGLSVPRLLGLDCDAARRRAADYGHAALRCEPVPAPSAREPVGRVFEQEPAAGGPALAAPTPISVSIWAAQPVTVPDVRERTLGEAVAAIDAARLVARPDERRGDRIVAEQSPAPGTIVDAASAVTLVTRQVTLVPDVVGQALAAAQSNLRESQLRGEADANDHADDRVVQSQSPAAHTRAPVGSAVHLATKRFASVPDLLAMSCAEARNAVAADTFELQCNEEQSWRATVFGTPKVVSQQPAASSRVEAGTRIVAAASVPLPASLHWLGTVSLTAVVASVALLIALALWLAWLVLRPAPHPAAEPSRTTVAEPPPPSLHWRVVADASPSVSLRPVSGAQGRGTRGAGVKIAWRVVPDAGSVLLRARGASNGGDDGRP